jgi:hypothetical protein
MLSDQSFSFNNATTIAANLKEQLLSMGKYFFIRKTFEISKSKKRKKTKEAGQ